MNNGLLSMKQVVFGVDQAEELLLDLGVEDFPFDFGVLGIFIEAAQEADGDFKAASHRPPATKKASLAILTKGFFNKFVGV